MSTLELTARFGGIALLILSNAFFVSIEFSAIASRRTRIDHLAAQGNRAAKLMAGWLDTPATRDRLVAASQVGITVASLALGALGESTFALLIEPPLAPLAVSPAAVVARPGADRHPPAVGGLAACAKGF